MAFDIINATLLSKLDDGSNDQFSVAYPAERSADSYASVGHFMVAPYLQAILTVGVGFLVSFEASTIDITYLNDTPIPGGQVVTLQLELAAGLSLVTDGSISTSKLADTAVTAAKIGAGAVTTAKILDGNVTDAKLASTFLKPAQIATGAITPYDGALDLSGGLGSGGAWGGITGTLTEQSDLVTALDGKADTSHNQTLSTITDAGSLAAKNTVAAGDIDAGAVTATELEDGAVTEDKLDDAVVSAGKLASLSVLEEKLADGAVTVSKLGDRAVTAAKMSGTAYRTLYLDSAGDAQELAHGTSGLPLVSAGASANPAWGQIAAAGIASDAVTTAKILDGNVTTDKILDDNITTAKILDANVTTAKLDADALALTSNHAPGLTTLEGFTLVNDFTPPYGMTSQVSGEDITALVGGGSGANTLAPSSASAGEITAHSTGGIRFNTSSSSALLTLGTQSIASDYVTIVVAFWPITVAGTCHLFTKHDHGGGYGIDVTLSSTNISVAVYTAASTVTNVFSTPWEANKLNVFAVTYRRDTGAFAWAKNVTTTRYGSGTDDIGADWSGQTSLAIFVGQGSSSTCEYVWFGAQEYTSSVAASRAQLEALVRFGATRFLPSAKVGPGHLAPDAAAGLRAASTSATGVLRIATQTETTDLTSATLAVCPLYLSDAMDAALGAAVVGALPIDDRTGTGSAITLDRTKSGYNHLIDENATIDENWAGEKVVRITNVDSSDHTLSAGGTGTINGASSITIVAGGSVTVEVRSNAATAPICFAEGDTTEDHTVYGATDFNDEVVSQAELKDYSETSTTPTSSSGTLALDLESGNVFEVALSENVSTLTFDNPPATGKAGSFLLIVVQDSTARTIAWPASVHWAGGTAPTLSTGSGDIDIFSFVTRNAGTAWYGFVGGQAFAVPA
jgi:hypothetical protein